MFLNYSELQASAADNKSSRGILGVYHLQMNSQMKPLRVYDGPLVGVPLLVSIIFELQSLLPFDLLRANSRRRKKFWKL